MNILCGILLYGLSRQRCPCCKSCTDCPGFQEVVNVKKAGLVIYRASACIRDVNGKEKPASLREILILHNTRNNDITSQNVLPEFDQYKKCPRCKYILEQAEKLLFKIPAISKLEVLGVCDKCRSKNRRGISGCECINVVKKFIAIKSLNKNETTEWRRKEFKLQHIFSRVTSKDENLKKSERAKSESFLDNLCRIKITKQIHQPRVDQLFESTKRLHGPNKIIDKRQERIWFSDAKQKSQILLNEYSDTDFITVDSELTHFGSNMNVRTKHDSDGNIVYYKALRRVSSSQESLTLNINDINKTKDSAEREKHIYSKYVQKNKPKDDNEYITFEIVQKSSTLEFVTKPERKRYIQNESQEFDDKFTTGTLRKSISLISKFEPKFKKDTVLLHPRRFHSEEALLSIVATTGESLRKDFSYFFMKEVEFVKKSLRQISSSELIKDTQDKLRSRDEKLKRKNEKELKLKLEEKKKKNAHKEQKKLYHEKTSEEEKVKKTLEDGKLLRAEKGIKDVKKLDEDAKKLNIKEKLNKTTRTASEKSNKTSKTGSKIDKTYSLMAKTSQKEKNKQEKLKFEKERKLIEKEKLKKEKEEQLQRAKEKIEIYKKEKEAQEKELEKRNKEKEDRLKYKEKEQTKYEDNYIKNKKHREQIEKENANIEKRRPSADKNVKEETELKLKTLQESEIITEPEKPKSQKKVEEPKSKGLNINQIKIRKSSENLILQLVKLKQSELDKPRVRPKRLSQLAIPRAVITQHMEEHKNRKLETCLICKDSELELDIEEIILNKEESTHKGDIIIGHKIFTYKPPLIEKSEEKKTIPIIYTSPFNDGIINIPEKEAMNILPEQLERKPPSILTGKSIEQEVPKGVIRYALSDRTFIDKGWTMLPTEKVVRKMNVYRMRPAQPEFNWFEHNKNKKIMHYDSGEKLAEFDDNGRGRWYYRSGRLALDYYDAQEINAQQRFVIYSSGEYDERGRSRPMAILATFDYLGNGIVFDHTGKIRLKYNQTEGVVLDRSIGPVSHWKWHNLNDPPVLQQVMIDTQMAHKDPDILKLGGPADNKTRPDTEEMLAIEFDNFIKEKSIKLSQKFKPFQIKMKALKINDYFSLKVLDQATVYVMFRDGTANLKLNIGMILDHQEIVDTDTAEVGEVSNSLERYPPRTDSLAGLQASVAYAQRVERARVEREHRLRPTQPCSSSDKLTAAIVRPLRIPLWTVPSDSTGATDDSRCKCRRPSPNNFYYDTRLV